MRTIKQIVKDVVLRVLLPVFYKRQSDKNSVIKGRVVFFETKEIKMPNSFGILFDRLTADVEKSVCYVTLAQNYVSYGQYLLNCIKALRLVARAEVVFLDDASDVISCIPLRSETKIIQLWHACGAFKKWGMSTADLLFGGTREEIRRHPFYKNLTLVTVSSPNVIWAYAEAMDLHDQEEIIKPIGVSRTDVYFDEGFIEKARDRLNKSFGIDFKKKIILYVPTFRGKANNAIGPDKLDIAAMKEALADDYALLIKHHPFVKRKPAIPIDCQDFAFTVDDDTAIEDLLCVADICISDYSSVIFEYSLFKRPMVFFAYDIDEYEEWRGFYYDYDELTPGPVYGDTESVIRYIRTLDEEFDPQEVASFREKFMCACDGHASDRIISEVFPVRSERP